MTHVAPAVVAVALVALLPACGFERTTKEDFESELTDSLAASLRSVSDASDAAPLAAATAGTVSGTGCDGIAEILATAPLCSAEYASQVLVTWSCVGPSGNGLTGTADVDTDAEPDACPPSELGVAQSFTIHREWKLDRLLASLDGASQLAWTNGFGQAADQKSMTVDLDHKLFRGGDLLRHQALAGTRSIAIDENGPGDADDAKVVDGVMSVEFVLAGVHAEVTETDLTFRRGCCHPLSGTMDYVLTGEASRAGSIAFGPACGSAKTSSGRALDLAPCPVE
jgi:hypothetical protein